MIKAKIIRKKPESFYLEKALREQNAMLRDIVKEMHRLFTEQSAFVHGVLVCELIDYHGENRAYEKAYQILYGTLHRAEKLATQDVVGK